MSTQRDDSKRKNPTIFTHMVPKESYNRIRSINIHYYHGGHISGFSFFDKDGSLLWNIGRTDGWYKVETVRIAENEVIVGVVAKLCKGWQTMYTDF
jgi:hypothetical protein